MFKNFLFCLLFANVKSQPSLASHVKDHHLEATGRDADEDGGHPDGDGGHPDGDGGDANGRRDSLLGAGEEFSQILKKKRTKKYLK